MKKILALFLAMTVLLALCACSSQAENRSEKEELIAILDEIAENASQKGAENKLQAIGSFGRLISWAKETDMKSGEIAATIGSWLNDRTPEQQAAVKQKLGEWGEALTRFGEEGGNEFFSRLGIDPGSWTESLRETIHSILDAVK